MRKQVTQISVTDDITHAEYVGLLGDGSDVDMVRTYRITITALDDNAKPVKDVAPFTWDGDMHDDTYDALTALITGETTHKLLPLMLGMLGLPYAMVNAMWDYISTGATGSLLSALGAKVRGTSGAGTSTSASGNRTRNPYTAMIRAVAIASGWTNANGSKVSEKGKLTQDVVQKFVTVTGITSTVFDGWDAATRKHWLADAMHKVNGGEGCSDGTCEAQVPDSSSEASAA